MEHAIGPWMEKREPGGTRWVVDATGDLVALVMGKAPGDHALVRSAPELLEIARQLRALLADADDLPWVKRLAEIEARFGIAP